VNRFVTAFAGRRDAYQLPIALHEVGLLETFITDAYLPSFWSRAARLLPGFGNKAANRKCDALTDASVQSKWLLALLEVTARRCHVSAKRCWAMVDRGLSLAAAKRAAATRSHFLLYEPYAWEAFTARYSHDPLRILFHFHPHPHLEAEILAADVAKHPPPTGQWLSLDGGLPRTSARRRRPEESWRHADMILCASTLTRRSLIYAGAQPEKCRVVPYGIELPLARPHDQPSKGNFEVLFVGNGIQRKGLHHLLTAWNLARLPAEAGLTLVCRDLDPRMIALIQHGNRNVTLLKGVSSDELARLYARSHLLVVPSLVEGFGFVYLEALSFGCPVLGTANTCLPDLGDETNGVFTVPPGDPMALAEFLKRFSSSSDELLAVRENASKCAERFTWPAFRRQLSSLVQGLVEARDCGNRES
jgi:glycosyltransferase involved in cell wall biosynthesis